MNPSTMNTKSIGLERGCNIVKDQELTKAVDDAYQPNFSG